MKNILNCCKFHVVFKNKTRLGNTFHLNDPILKNLTSGVAYKLKCGRCNKTNYSECVRHLTVRIGGYIAIYITYRLIIKQVNPKNSFQ